MAVADDNIDLKLVTLSGGAVTTGKLRIWAVIMDCNDEGDLTDDLPLSQDFRLDLMTQLEEEKDALSIVPSSTSAEAYYNEVKQEIESNPDQ